MAIESDIPGIFYASYVYDPLGRRIEKTEEGATTRYQYDGLDVVAEYDGSNALQATFVFGPGIDEPLKVRRGGSVAAYHADGLGSVVALSDVDDPGGSDLATYAYDAFGKLTSPPPPFENTYTYTGRELDASGLYYYRARYYLPAAGRFLSPDPSGLAGGLNPYVYVSSNPVNFRDPFGLAAWGGTNDAATPLGGSSGLLDQKLGVASRIGVAGVGAAGAVGLGYGVGAILGATGCVASVVCGVAVGAVAVTAIGYDLYNGGASRIANSFSSFFSGDVTVRQALEVGALSSGLGTLAGVGIRSATRTAIQAGSDLVQSTAREQAARGTNYLLNFLKPAEKAAFLADPSRGSRFLGQAVHRATAQFLRATNPGRFQYSTRGADFLDLLTGEVIELTTPREVGRHLARAAMNPANVADIVTYTLP